MNDTLNVNERVERTQCQHDYETDYYGFYHCNKCGDTLPPWAFDSDEEISEDDCCLPDCPVCGGEWWDGGTSCTCNE